MAVSGSYLVKVTSAEDSLPGPVAPATQHRPATEFLVVTKPARTMTELGSYAETGYWGKSLACPSPLMHCGIRQEEPGRTWTPEGHSEAPEHIQWWEELVVPAAAGRRSGSR